jgi:hypothetical protein
VKVYYDQSPTGVGKTTRAITALCQQPCRALFITERKNAFDELEGEMRRIAAHMGTNALIRRIHSNPSNRGGSVVEEIEALPDRYAGCSHLIIIATHAALLRSDFSGFSGWRIVVDEVPAFLDFEEKRTHLDAGFFKQHYLLEQVVGRWRAVTLTKAGHAVSAADIRADQSHAHLSVFHARVKEASRTGAKRIVLSNLADWQEMADRKVQWCWASVFSLRELSAFDRVELLGNRFRADIGSILADWLEVEEIEWEELPPLTSARRFENRPLTIHYFFARSASKSLFSTDQERAALEAIGRHLITVLPQAHSIWTANDTADPGATTPKDLLGSGPIDVRRAI